MPAIVYLVLLAVAAWLTSQAFNLFEEEQRRKVRFSFFALRDRLYHAAASGLIPTSSQEFKSIRNIINSIISVDFAIGADEFLTYTWSFVRPLSADEHRGQSELPEAGEREGLDIINAILTSFLQLCRLNSGFAARFLNSGVKLLKAREAGDEAWERRLIRKQKRMLQRHPDLQRVWMTKRLSQVLPRAQAVRSVPGLWKDCLNP